VHDDRTLVEGRIGREWFERIVPAVHPERRSLEVDAAAVAGEPIAFGDALALDFSPVAIGDPWGRPWGTVWFRLRGEVPDAWGDAADLLVDLDFDRRYAGFQAEALVRNADGRILGSIHPRRNTLPLASVGITGAFELYVEAAANPCLAAGFAPTPMGRWHTAPERPLYRLAAADVARRDETVYGLAMDVEVLEQLMRTMDATDPRRQRILRTIERALDALDLHDVPATAAPAREVLRPALVLPARASAHRMIAVGHAHIDTAWLWPLRETVRKCIRTFAGAVELMDRFPEYRFACSQAVQYQWIADREPELFSRITDKVRNGQWVPVGGMWVEADMNLPGGESLVRQLVHGQRAFEGWFGQRCEEVWIPDVFGYPGSLPQLFALAGCTRFVTQKLSWNKQNRFPHHTFWWEGIDGTRVLTHFPPVETYNSELVPREMDHAVRTFRDHGWSDWSLVPFGHGNGGGGPTREMLERARRLGDLDGAPRVQLGTPDDFFERVEAEIGAGPDAPVFRGELYFEMHRGTLTSQLRTKTGNRTCERLFREAELWWAHAEPDAAVLAAFDGWWKEVLVQQFHDIIPGSSIGWVHDDAEEVFTRVGAALEQSVSAAIERIAPTGGVVANARTADADEVVLVEDEPMRVVVPGLGVAPTMPVELAEPADRVVTTSSSLSNGLVSVEFDEHGQLAAVTDLVRGRALLRPGRAGAVLEIAPDHPVEYDAWDLESWARRRSQPITSGAAQVVRSHPLLGEVRVVRTFGRSTATVTYRLRAGSQRLDVEVDLDWQEDERVLSLAFPLAPRSDVATCGIQFGHVTRPTHASTPWDAAKFEVCAHRWVDVSEPSFGVAVLNDGRFGHALQHDAVQVTLARAPRYPDPTADRGRHRCTVALLPHGAGLLEVLREAEALELPLRVVPGTADRSSSFRQAVRVVEGTVLVTAVKPADDGSGDVIVRLHEAHGDHTRAVLAVGDRAAHVAALTEERSGALPVEDGHVRLELRPFEIVTIRLGRR
jgi:alpha-mannosidase